MTTPLSARSIDADVVVVGSGFAGALAALALRRRGRRVALVERGRHPRFAIGESTTPLTNLLLEELADRYDLAEVRPFSKWSTWQRARPDVACGLKRGFSFFFHERGRPFHDDERRERQLLVAASPHDGAADTHWYRADFDKALVDLACRAGVEYLDETDVDRFEGDADGVRLDGRRHGQRVAIAAGFAIDATGPRGFISRALGGNEAPLQWLPPTQGLYSHFHGVRRWDEVMPASAPTTPPYPLDDAALHHVFDGGWIWMLRFNNGVTSAGAALIDAVAAEIGGAADGAEAWSALLDRLPSVREQFAGAEPVMPFVHARRLAVRHRQLAGASWALLPSAAGVIDPLLSTGFPLTLLGLLRLLDLLECTAPGPERAGRLDEYARVTQTELDVTEQLVAALYASMTDPPLFTRLGLLYFAAASYSETVRRLGRPHLAPGFLLHAHPVFGPELTACAATARERPTGAARQALFDRIDRVVAPFDTAGLTDRSRRNWYPVLASDLREGAWKLEASAAEVEALIARFMGPYAAAPPSPMP